jgi:hypothetical protein
MNFKNWGKLAEKIPEYRRKGAAGIAQKKKGQENPGPSL